MKWNYQDFGKHSKRPADKIKAPKPILSDAEIAKKAQDEKTTGIPTEKAAQLIKERGWVEITAPLIKTNIYLIADPAKSKWKHYKPPPNPDLPRYTLAEIEALNGLIPKYVRMMHIRKKIFKGTIQENACYGNGWGKVFPVKGLPYWEKNGKKVLVKDSHNQKRKVYLARKDAYTHQKTMADKGEDARQAALEKLKAKVEAEMTPQKLREATDRNIAKIRAAHADRQIERNKRKEENEHKRK